MIDLPVIGLVPAPLIFDAITKKFRRETVLIIESTVTTLLIGAIF